MGTIRISRFNTSPSTTFQLEADRTSQDIVGNHSVVTCYMAAYNGPGGNSTSYSNDSGTQLGQIVGINNFYNRTQKPFLPSGYSNGATRWRDGPYNVVVPHNPDGTRGQVQLRMYLQYGSGPTVFDDKVWFNDFPRIPRGPRVKVDGVWRNTVAYIKDAGAWKIAIPYVKDGGTWKVGGG